MDRLALGLLLQDIKVDLNLSDTQLGLLSGIAFALFYSVMGIPIGRWVDRGNRITIITATTALWSAAVALCGTAGSFLHLLLIRIGVAVGEAGCIPPAHSLIADYFDRTQRPRAVAVYMLGGPLSMLIGYFLAGWLNECYGWRVTFVLLGLPGLGLAALAYFTLMEPRRRALASDDASEKALEPTPTVAIEKDGNVREQPSLRQVCVSLWKIRTFRHVLLCLSVVYFFGYGILQWQPAFFIRTYGLATGELGMWFALIWGGGGLLGTYLGGEMASRYAANDERLQLQAMALVYASFGAISVGIYISPDYRFSLALLAIAAVGITAVYGPLFATVQTLVPERVRGVSIAVIYLCANLVGMGLGPLAAGALSDALRPWAGEESLRYALLALCPGYLWAGWHAWRASHTVVRDLSVAYQVVPNTLEAPPHRQWSAGRPDAGKSRMI